MSFLEQLGSSLKDIGDFAQKAQPIYNQWEQNNTLMESRQTIRDHTQNLFHTMGLTSSYTCIVHQEGLEDENNVGEYSK